MNIYRISTKQYINDITGTGARLYGGRWNEKGTAVLYCSENISLAILEVLVHFDGLTIPKDLFLLTIHIAERDIIQMSKAKFLKLKDSISSENKFKKEGMNWMLSQKSLGLKVPSIITQYESNILINPEHENFTILKKLKVEKLELDERLFRMKSDS